VSGIDPSGNLWFFGGMGYAGGYFGYHNDLWKCNPATLEWTWISGTYMANQVGIYGTKGAAGPSNIPGGREGAVFWIDSLGKLWLFGGNGLDGAGNLAYLNDLWKFDPTTLEWTWISGSNTVRQAGVYGTRGIPDPSNVPGARSAAVSWLDSSGKLWLFGGDGFDSANYGGQLNDLWMFDPTTLDWTWVSGSDTVNQTGIYGTKGTAAPANVPGARFGALSWLDPSGKLWLFGGGYGNSSFFNDLWKFDTTTLEWTWVSGSSAVDQAGIYGTKGTAAPSNVPGARVRAVSWVDSQGKLWLFGGWGYVSAGEFGYFNDLWQYTR